MRLWILSRAKNGPVTMLYSAKDEAHNQAVALKDYLESYRFFQEKHKPSSGLTWLTHFTLTNLVAK